MNLPLVQEPVWKRTGQQTPPSAESVADYSDQAPLRGLITLLIASIICQCCVPMEVRPVGALRLPALILGAGLLGWPLWAAHGDLRRLLQPHFILMAAPVFWLLLDMIQGSYPLWGFGQDDVRKTFLCISLFSISVWVTAFRPQVWLVRSLPAGALREFPPHVYFSIGLVAFAMAFLRFAIPCGFDFNVMFNALLEDRWSAPWARGAIGDWDSFLDHVAYFGYILPVLTVVLSRRIGWLAPRTLILAGCSVIITLFIAQGGGRRIVGVLLGSALAYWFLTLKRVNIRAAVVFCTVIICIGTAMNFILEIRGTGLGERAEQEVPFENDETESDFVFLHIDDQFLRLTQMCYIFPTFADYVGWDYITYVVVRPIPRALWPGKPVGIDFDVSAALGGQGASLTTSVIGELIMCGGYFAIILGGLFYGCVAAALVPLRSARFGTGGRLLYSCGLLMLFAGFRSMAELILMSYMLLAYIALAVFYNRFSRGDS
jgi:hypothetical protein